MLPFLPTLIRLRETLCKASLNPCIAPLRLFTPSRESTSSLGSPFRRSHRGRHGELSIFGAERYFSEKVDVDGEDQIKRDSRTNKNRSMTQTKNESKPIFSPGVNSESSWNSQSSALFVHDQSRNNSQSKSKKLIPSGLRFFSGIQCKGSCYDIQPPIRYTHQLIKHPSRVLLSSSAEKKNVKRDANFAFPVLNARISKDKDEEEPTTSIEVLGLHNKPTEKDEIVMNLERKLSMLTWDANPRTRGSSVGLEEDVESHASSNLFEISVFPARMMSHLTGQCESTEARSIHWSMVRGSCSGSEANFSKAFYSERGDGKANRGGGEEGCSGYHGKKARRTEYCQS